MKNTWCQLLRRLAAGCAISGATAWSSAMCYAAQLAYDDATDPVYADGWQGRTTNNDTGAVETTGDNGGFGFEPWDFDNDWLFNPPPAGGEFTIDSSNPFNNVGTAWRMALADNMDIIRAGRGFAPLQVGQTFRAIVDNPNDRLTFRGYFIRFNSRNGEAGGGNICYQYSDWTTACSAANPNEEGERFPIGATPEPKLNVRRFEGFDIENTGKWGVADGDAAPDDFNFTTLYDTDDPMAVPPQVGTDSGLQIDLEITAVDTYKLTMTPLDNPGAAYMQTGLLSTPGEPIDWIEFTFFNTMTDPAPAPGFPSTDFFIKSLEIIGPAPPGVPGDYNNNGTVDAADYVLWRKHLGTAFQLPNEVPGTTPGMVTVDDYNAWRTRFGSTSGAGTGSGLTGGTVPEPGTFVYIIAGAMGLAVAASRKM